MAHLTHLHALLSQVDEFTATKNIEIALELLIEFMNYLCVEVEAILKELESAPNNSAPEVKKEPVGELLDANKDVKQESLKKTSTDDIIQPIPINAYDRMISPNTFWDRVNDTWIRVLQAGNKLSPSDWAAVGDALESSCNVLELYGLVDYKYGIMEESILKEIHHKIYSKGDLGRV